jgi:hypothetical protein
MAATNVQAFSGDVEIASNVTAANSKFSLDTNSTLKQFGVGGNNNYIKLMKYSAGSASNWKIATGSYSGSTYQWLSIRAKMTRLNEDVEIIQFNYYGHNGTSHVRDSIVIGGGGSSTQANEIKVYNRESNSTYEIYLQIDSATSVEVEITHRNSTIDDDSSTVATANNGAIDETGLTKIYDSGTTTDLRLKEGNVGIGTTDPSQKLSIAGVTLSHLSPGGQHQGLRVTNENVNFGSSAGIGMYVASAVNAVPNASVTNTLLGNIDTYWANATDAYMRFFVSPTNSTTPGDPKMVIKNDGNVGIGTTNPVSGLTVSKDIESTNSFITERVLFKETWPNGLNSLAGDLGTWVVTNLNLQTNPSVTTTPDGYGIVALNGDGVVGGEFVSPAFDLSDYAIVDGTLQANDKRKTTTRVFMKFWLGTKQLDSNPEILQVQFSPDNGSTWYTVATAQDRASVDRFTMVSADLSPYILDTSTQAKIRFYMPWTVAGGDYMRIGRIWIHESDVPTNLGGMWLGAGGNIGIGTTNPAATLDVRGSGQYEGIYSKRIWVANIGDNSGDGSPDDNTGSPWRGLGFDNLAWNDQSHKYSADIPILSGYNGVALRSGGGNLVLTEAGNIGIGTTGPVGVNGGQRLEGSSSTGFEYIATRDSTMADGEFIGGYLFKNTDPAGEEPHYAGMAAYAFGANGNMDLRFFAGRDVYEDTPTVPHMTIAKSGKVGIGTTDPDCALSVTGDRTTSSPGAGIHMGMAGTNLTQYAMLQINATDRTEIDFSTPDTDANGRIGYDNTNNNMYFRTNGVDNRLFIQSDGKVGINETSPQTTLDISGDFQSYSGRHVKTVPIRHNGYNDIAGNGNFIRVGDIVPGQIAGYSGSFCAFNWFGTSSIQNFSADRWVQPNRIRLCFRWGFVAGHIAYVTFKIWETLYSTSDSLKATITSYNASLSRGFTTVWGPTMTMIRNDVPGLKIEVDSNTTGSNDPTIRISDIWFEYIYD